jgi:DNA-binding NarL/FixJ family response regulator
MDDTTEDMEGLTQGEMDVLRLVAQGADNKAVADQLALSERTVANRLSSIYEKLQVNNRTQAALVALRRGWAMLNQDEE